MSGVPQRDGEENYRVGILSESFRHWRGSSVKPDQPQSDPQPNSGRRPWAALTVGGFLLLCGIGASIYSFIAITWTTESTSEVIYIESSTAPPVSASRTETEYLDPDRPIRTSTTRRRTTPREVRRPSRPATTIAREEESSSQGTSSGRESSTGDDGDEDNETSSSEQGEENGSSDERSDASEEQSDNQEPATNPAVPSSQQSVD